VIYDVSSMEYFHELYPDGVIDPMFEVGDHGEVPNVMIWLDGVSPGTDRGPPAEGPLTIETGPDANYSPCIAGVRVGQELRLRNRTKTMF